MRVEHGSAIAIGVFHDNAAANGVTLKFSGIESYTYLSAGERYHAPMHRVLSVLRRPHQSLRPETCLHLILKGINYTTGPNGLVATLLVLGALPSLAVTSSIYLLQNESMMGFQSAREEMGAFVAEARIAQSLSSMFLPSARYSMSPVDDASMYREWSGDGRGLPPWRLSWASRCGSRTGTATLTSSPFISSTPSRKAITKKTSPTPTRNHRPERRKFT